MTTATQTERFSCLCASDLMDRLTSAQNHPANIRIDIMTFAGMCDSRAELEIHVERYERVVAQHRAPAKKATKAPQVTDDFTDEDFSADFDINGWSQFDLDRPI